MRKQSFDYELTRLQGIAGGPISDEAVDALRSALRGSQSTLAAFAAEIAGNRRIAALIADLVAAFDRFMTNPDKGCRAKTAIVAALGRLDWVDDTVLLRGIRHVQMEPAFGGPIDVADDLRAECAVMLANIRHPLAHLELTRLMVDRELKSRRAAVKALAHLGTDGAEMVIRLKALVGDAEPEILGECFTALLGLSPERSLGFVGEFLDSSPTVAEQAALALGQSHEARAFELLRDSWEGNLGADHRRMLLLPIALLRRDDAFDFLVDVVESSGPKLAEEAVKALGVYADDSHVRRVKAAVEKRNDASVSAAFEREFGKAWA